MTDPRQPRMIYQARTRSRGLLARVLINDCPIHVFHDGEHLAVNMDYGAFVVEGDNRFEVQAAPLADADEPRELEAAIMARWSESEHERDPERDLVCDYVWTPDESPLQAEGFTTVLLHRMRVDKAFGHYRWEDAAPYMPRERARVVAAVSALRDALAARDLAAVLKRLEPKHVDLARVNGATLADQLDRQAGFLRIYLDDESFEMAPIDPDALVLTSWARGRLVQVTDAEGFPPLVGFGGGFPFMYGLMLSHIDGAWEVVR